MTNYDDIIEVYAPCCPVGESYLSKISASRPTPSLICELCWRWKWRDWTVLQAAQGIFVIHSFYLSWGLSLWHLYHINCKTTLLRRSRLVLRHWSWHVPMLLVTERFHSGPPDPSSGNRLHFKGPVQVTHGTEMICFSKLTKFSPAVVQIWRWSSDEISCSHDISRNRRTHYELSCTR